jgi:hypothetical protein
VIFDFETLGCQHGEIRWARMNVKDLLTVLALKMMMMSVIAQLKSWVFTRQHDLT